MADLSPVVSLLAGFAGGLAIAGWPRCRLRRRRRGGDQPSRTTTSLSRIPEPQLPPIKPQPAGGRMLPPWPW
jgi:hypothetical protein